MKSKLRYILGMTVLIATLGIGLFIALWIQNQSDRRKMGEEMVQSAIHTVEAQAKSDSILLAHALFLPLQTALREQNVAILDQKLGEMGLNTRLALVTVVDNRFRIISRFQNPERITEWFPGIDRPVDDINLLQIRNKGTHAWIEHGMVFSALPIKQNNQFAGAFIVAYPIEYYAENQTWLKTVLPRSTTTSFLPEAGTIFVFLLLVSGIAILFYFKQSQRTQIGIRELSHCAQFIGQQDYDRLIATCKPWLQDGKDNELGRLALALVRVTEELKLNTISKEYLRAIFSHMRESLLVFNQNGRVLSANSASKNLLTQDGEHLEGQMIADFVSFENFSDNATLHRLKNNAGMETTLEGQFRRANGDEVPMLFGVSKITPEKGIESEDRYILVASDISKQKDFQKALLEARASADAANRAKSGFLANMSHELRTPLNAIIGFSDLMCSEGFGPLGNERYKEYAGDINYSGRHLLSIINDVLDMAKIEAGKIDINLGWTALEEIIEPCLTLVSGQAVSNKIELTAHYDPAIEINADQKLLKQILINLLTNAVKFTPTRGSVSLKAKFTPMGAYISVSDNGIGIAAKNISRILKPFEQVDNQLSRPYEGTGLGLAMVKSMIERLGGCFRLSSIEGTGTIAIMRFPASSWRLQPTRTAMEKPQDESESFKSAKAS